MVRGDSQTREKIYAGKLAIEDPSSTFSCKCNFFFFFILLEQVIEI